MTCVSEKRGSGLPFLRCGTAGSATCPIAQFSRTRGFLSGSGGCLLARPRPVE